ncbi:MAG: bifunctional hydroxymethylpyrimidine kinase/phosphomethylpyrimidine kinase [Thermodesulfovibrionales bacterium]
MIPVALTIAGFDPTSGAGITADVKVLHSLGVYCIGVVSSITVQDTRGVRQVQPLSASLFRRQLDVVLDDIAPRSAKTGLIYERSAIRAICSQIESGRLRRVVVDPVVMSTSGKSLIARDALHALIEELIPRSYIVTPNIPEASLIAGMRIYGVEEVHRAAEKIRALGAQRVVITGGHLKGAPVDTYYDGRRFRHYGGTRRRGTYHGTGCAFSAALAAFTALGASGARAVERAKSFLESAMDRSIRLGQGMRLLGG